MSEPDDLTLEQRFVRAIFGEEATICRCGCPADAHVGEIGCPCGLPGEPPCSPEVAR